ncbi:putative transcription factor C2H2 family [Helianthus anomalus]
MKFLDRYLKIGVVSAAIGGSMEYFMIKTGFCQISKKSSGALDADSVQFENLTARKVESDISVEELLRYGDPNKKSKRRIRVFEKRVCDDDDSYTLELERQGPNKKRNKYKCLNRHKVFTSFQGLGGHRPCHKKNNTVGSKHDSGENSLEGDFAHTRKVKYDKKTKVEKIKGHKCPICFWMFKSGQALGGHKRSHFINGSMDQYAAMGHAAPSCSDMIDLNLAAPEEDQD